jgi:anhydro-N-acetylmuramic acid kinase
MSGTSLDGVDGVIVALGENSCKVLHTHATSYPDSLRHALFELHQPGDSELDRTARISNELSRLYAENIEALLTKASLNAQDIRAVGCHGQTIRHQPEAGYTLQIFNPALLVELTGITVIADFRNRDIAAGGQGAPLVPAFHQAVFGSADGARVVVNIGGIANLTILPETGPVIGFDSGPGNMLMDSWVELHTGQRFDKNGAWAASGKVIVPLLEKLLAFPYFSAPIPKSTGRDTFNMTWLSNYLGHDSDPVDVQRTLLELTARTIADAILHHCTSAKAIYLCGGGAYNQALYTRLQQLLHPATIHLTDALGIGVNWVEAAAFAWLARACVENQPGNLPEVTGARGSRILGAIYAY